MKRLTPQLLICFFLVSITATTTAQEVAAHSIKAALPFATEEAAKSNAATSAILDQPAAKLTNALSNHFPAADQQQWWHYKDGYYVKFLNGERKARAVFNKKGMLQYAITDCNLTQLPLLLREKIAQNYSGYTLLHAMEINAHAAVAHQAVLHNEKGYITLKATAGQIEEVDATTN
jgi:hypothetical protein